MGTLSLKERAARVRLLAMDADGVLTDGSINIDDLGHETKCFSVRDGFGLRVWREMGFHAAIITGRGGSAIEHRARELKIPHLCRDAGDKCAALGGVLRELNLRAEEVAFLGDDWPDLKVMALCGYPMAVADAEEAVARAAVFRTRRAGGHGAVRDAVEHLLASRGLMERALGMYDPRADGVTEDRGVRGG